MEIQSILLLIGSITGAVVSIMKVIKKSNCFKHCLDIETVDNIDAPQVQSSV